MLARALYKDMSEHKVTLKWERAGADFSYQKYPRDHTWSFDGGHTMTATAAPAYFGNPAHVDPEEAFVASLSSCHMLTFLAIACKQRFVIDSPTKMMRLVIWRKISKASSRSVVSSYAQRLHGAATENPVRKSSIKCTMPPTKIVSLPTQLEPW